MAPAVTQTQILKRLYRPPEAPLRGKSIAEFKVNLSHPLSPTAKWELLYEGGDSVGNCVLKGLLGCVSRQASRRSAP